ncbi:ABC transporter permease [candidate division KSB1 bacterium]|nr:ABC transporter permease [candidate division KSB1 bacterium]
MIISLSELSEGFRIALHALKTNRLRTILTTLGILIGVVVITVIISVIQGMNTYVSGELSAIGTDNVFVTQYPWMINSWEEWLRVRGRPKIDSKHFEFIQEYATLAEVVAPEVATRRTVKYRNEDLTRVIIYGTTPGYMVLSDAMPEFGRFFNDSEMQHRRNVCVIGWEIADKLYKDVDPIGKRIKIGSQSFFILGVMEERGQLFDFSMDNNVLIPYTVFQKAFGKHRSLEIQAKAVNPELVEELKDELEELMRRTRGLKVGQENDFNINQQSQLMDVYNNLTKVLWIVLIGIGSIALLVGGIGIMNIMLVSVTERTREIGIRKALGAKRKVILLQFLVESMFISSIGVILGLLISIGLATAIKQASPIPVDISGWVALLGVGFTVTIGLFFGLYPASKASKLDPIEALRYE